MPHELESELRGRWEEAQVESDSNRKGRLLEDFIQLLFKTIPGFHQVDTRRRNEVEEIDLVIRNDSSDATWQEESPYFMVECKNWSRPVGVDEVRLFLGKLERKYHRCKLGFFVVLGDFARTVRMDQLGERRGDFLIVPINHQDIVSLVHSLDRNETLKSFHQRAVLAENGHHTG